METVPSIINLFIWSAAGAALLYGILLSLWIFKLPSGDSKMRDIATAIQEGASAYLLYQYRVVALVAAILAVIIYFALGGASAVGFLVGAFFSALAALRRVCFFSICQKRSLKV